MVSNLDLQRNVSTLKSQLTSTQEAWQGFKQGEWVKEVNVRDFIQKNYTPYQGDESFLETVTPATDTLWNEVKSLMVQEREKGVLDAETKIPSSIPEFLTKSAIAKHRSLTGSGFEQSDRRFPQPTVCCQILS
ncbi:hypothetical protein [Crocosphaera watsonii]|uniref:hypothetical protein n=1 Tax=Crocosphaera watsonii TaxID=263511 RepID=UPI0030D79EAE